MLNSDKALTLFGVVNCGFYDDKNLPYFAPTPVA